MSVIAALLVSVGLAACPQGQFSTAGRASVFTDTVTASGRSGVGISTWFYGRLNGYWLVKAPNGRMSIERQQDNGPAASTGRWLDLYPATARRFGYPGGEYTFPTDRGRWYGRYLGKRLPKGLTTGTLHCAWTTRTST